MASKSRSGDRTRGAAAVGASPLFSSVLFLSTLFSSPLGALRSKCNEGVTTLLASLLIIDFGLFSRCFLTRDNTSSRDADGGLACNRSQFFNFQTPFFWNVIEYFDNSARCSWATFVGRRRWKAISAVLPRAPSVSRIPASAIRFTHTRKVLSARPCISGSIKILV